MNNQGTYFANGKLLISGEYLVLDGATALAVPLKYGQWMRVKQCETGKDELIWNAYIRNESWFSATYSTETCELKVTSDIMLAERLRNILKTIKKLNPDFPGNTDIEIFTNLEFLPQWGWGSSSTLISNLAAWSKIDPYVLNKEINKGSGYDIACAWKSASIYYRLKNEVPQNEPANFNPEFKSNIFFVYLNKKQSSDIEVKLYREKRSPSNEEIKRISEISVELVNAGSINSFNTLIAEHEYIISGILDRKPVKNELFSDFEGAVKSLGAWNGDFVMAVSEEEPGQVIEYFKKKGYRTIFSFDEIIK